MFVEGVGFEPTMSYASLQQSLVAYTVAFDLSANLPLFRLLRENLVLASFILARCLFHPFHVHL